MPSFDCDSLLSIVFCDANPGEFYFRFSTCPIVNIVVGEAQITLRHTLFHAPYACIDLPDDAKELVYNGYKQKKNSSTVCFVPL